LNDSRLFVFALYAIRDVLMKVISVKGM